MQVDSLDVAFRLVRNQPLTTAESMGLTLPFLLDFNYDHYRAHPSVIAQWRARADGGLARQRHTHEVLVGGRLRVPSRAIWPSPGMFEETGYAGTVGLPFYKAFSVNWDDEVFSVGNQPALPAGFEELNAIRRNGAVYQVVAAEVDGRAARLVLVPGYSMGVGLYEPYFRRQALWDAYPRRRDVQAYDGGGVTHRVVVARRFKLGPLEMDEPIVRLERRPGIEGADGYIGMDMLRRLNVRVDRSVGMKVWAGLSRQAGEPQLDDRGGVTLVKRAEGWMADQVDPAGPAYKAGVRDGDMIVEHEGDGGLEGLAFALTRAAGTVVPIKISRDGGAFQPIRIELEERV
ncbi:MAG TPA: hypothetical protein VGB49_08350 [Caulobacteraceae bacterium]